MLSTQLFKIPLKAEVPKAKGCFIFEVMDDKSVQFRKALFPIVVTELGISMEVNPLQPLKALLAIVCTE